MQFGDKDILTDLLMSTKFISGSYHKAVLESANDKIRNTLIQLNNDEVNLQKQIFNLMSDRNWHELHPYHAAPLKVKVSSEIDAMDMQQQMPY